MLAAAVAAYSHPAAAETDPRAVEECKVTSATFVQISECVPIAHVAFRTMDAFQAIYPQEAQPLADRCRELNSDRIVGTEACVRTAIDAAVQLQASMPAGSAIEDPIFNAVRSDELRRKLSAEIQKARSDFPDIRLWGGGSYQPYR